jgi:hypothetical protein
MAKHGMEHASRTSLGFSARVYEHSVAVSGCQMLCRRTTCDTQSTVRIESSCNETRVELR